MTAERILNFWSVILITGILLFSISTFGLKIFLMSLIPIVWAMLIFFTFLFGPIFVEKQEIKLSGYIVIVVFLFLCSGIGWYFII